MPGAERRRLAVDEVDRLVAVEADAVAGAVGQAGQAVAGAVAPALVLARAPHRRRCPRGGRSAPPAKAIALAAMHLVPDPALLGIGLAEHEGARDVRLIALDRAAAVHQHDLAVAHLPAAGPSRADRRSPRRAGSGRIRDCRRAPAVAPFMIAPICAGVMPRSIRGRGVAIGGDGDVGRLLHQRQLVRRLDHPAAAHDRRAGLGSRCPASRARPSTAKKRTVSSIPTGPVDPAVAQEAGDGLERVCHARSRCGPRPAPSGSRGPRAPRRWG